MRYSVDVTNGSRRDPVGTEGEERERVRLVSITYRSTTRSRAEYEVEEIKAENKTAGAETDPRRNEVLRRKTS
jgi:hypothetical protein